MKNTKILMTLFTAVFITSGCTDTPYKDFRPNDLALKFCAAVIANDENAAVRLMTPALQSQIAAAKLANEAAIKAHPQDKPPLGNGIGLISAPDMFVSCTPIAVKGDRVTLQYVHSVNSDEGWQDTLLLSKSPEGPRIADIIYPDGNGRISEFLKEAVANAELPKDKH